MIRAKMVDICEVIKALLKHKKIDTDNNIFRLHHKFSVILLLVFSLMVTSKQFFGTAISCEPGRSMDTDVINNYCWIYSTFTVKKHLTGTRGVHNVAPGVGPYPSLSFAQTEEIIRHKYYQWVCIVLFFQAAMFYIPKYIWKIWEGGRLALLVRDFGSPLVPPSWNLKSKQNLMKYFQRNHHANNLYMLKFMLCEILNAINVILQIFFMNWFLEGQFASYGIATAVFSDEFAANYTNPMAQVFPKLAKCTYARYGPSGTIENIDALCILSLNIVNEKIYIVLWFWFIGLAFASILMIAYRIVVLFCPTFRTYLLMAVLRNVKYKSAHIIVNSFSFGDWFLLFKVGKNVNPIIFEELLYCIEFELTDKRNGTRDAIITM